MKLCIVKDNYRKVCLNKKGFLNELLLWIGCRKDFICLFKDKTEDNMYESQFIK